MSIILSVKVLLSRCMGQVVASMPQLLGSVSIENLEAKVYFLLSVGVGEDQIGQVGSSRFAQGSRDLFRV